MQIFFSELICESPNEALHGKALARMLDAKPLFMHWWRSAFNEVNYWSIKSHEIEVEDRYIFFQKRQLSTKVKI